MSTLLAIGLTNALTATILAILVWCVTRVWRQPAVAHLLWVLVLVKFVTPPVVSIPWPFELYTRNVVESMKTTRAIEQHVGSGTTGTSMPALIQKFARPGDNQIRVSDGHRIDVTTREPPPWEAIAIAAWLVGSAVWLLTAAVRLTSFHRALRNTIDCPADISRLADQVAARLGVTGRFRLRMTEARLSPLVWPIGRPTIVLSRQLLAELSGEEVEMLLAHELAHLKRKDHWLRWLELGVTAIYWWHPVLWWTRRKIHKAEEQACDAWVVWAFPEATKRYASALFKVIQMVSDQRTIVPLVASQFGSARNLKERIENIMNATWKSNLSMPVRMFVILLALLTLPISLSAISSANDTAAASTPAVDEKGAAARTNDRYSGHASTNEKRSDEHGNNEELAALREHVRFLAEHFKRIDALNRIGERGGSADAKALSGYELATAESELALAEGHHDEAVAKCQQAAQLADEAMKSVMASYESGRVSLQLVLETARHLSDSKIRLSRVRGSQASIPGNPSRESNDSRDLQRLAVQSARESESSPSVTVWKKMLEVRKHKYERLKLLADKKVVSVAELEQAKLEYDLGVAQYEHALRTLKYAQLLVELAETEYQEAVEKNKAAPNTYSEFELRKLKIKVELAKVKMSEVE